MDPLLGQVELFPYDFTPEGWLPCNGQTLRRQDHSALFAILGETFGGDGKTTFALPNLRDAPKGLTYHIAARGVFPSRS